MQPARNPSHTRNSISSHAIFPGRLHRFNASHSIRLILSSIMQSAIDLAAVEWLRGMGWSCSARRRLPTWSLIILDAKHSHVREEVPAVVWKLNCFSKWHYLRLWHDYRAISGEQSHDGAPPRSRQPRLFPHLRRLKDPQRAATSLSAPICWLNDRTNCVLNRIENNMPLLCVFGLGGWYSMGAMPLRLPGLRHPNPVRKYLRQKFH